MYYYIKRDDKIEKYKVVFDKETLDKLRTEIINKCSIIEHIERTGTRKPNYFDYLKIRNYKEKKVGRTEPRDNLFYSPEDIYWYSYDQYNFPYLVKLIDELLKKDVQAVYKIYNPDFDREPTSLEIKRKVLCEEINNIPNDNTNKKISKLEELQKLIEQIKINESQESVIPYYKEVQEAILLVPVDIIDIDIIKKVETFYDKVIYYTND